MQNIRKSRNQAGFTLAELMAVIVLSSLSITFIYFLFIHQSQLSRIQNEIGEMQTSLQFAVSSVERDLRRAGYMSIITNTDRRLCAAYPGNDFNAINFVDGTSALSTAPTSTRNVFIRADSIDLFGNYTTTNDFRGFIDPADSAHIIIDFKDTTINSVEAFENAFFTPNQLVMIRGQSGQMQIVQLITSNTTASNVFNVATQRARFAVANGLQLRNTPACGIAIEFRVAPLHKIRYRIQARSTDNWELVREVLDPGTCTAAGACNSWAAMSATSPHPPLAIAPNAVDLQFWFTTWNPTTNQPNNWDPRCGDMTSGTCATVQVAQIHNDRQIWPLPDPATIRSAFFRVAVRSANEDPSLPFFARPNNQSTLLTFDLNPAEQGAARVRNIVKNVMLFNMLAR